MTINVEHYRDMRALCIEENLQKTIEADLGLSRRDLHRRMLMRLYAQAWADYTAQSARLAAERSSLEALQGLQITEEKDGTHTVKTLWEPQHLIYANFIQEKIGAIRAACFTKFDRVTRALGCVLSAARARQGDSALDHSNVVNGGDSAS